MTPDHTPSSPTLGADQASGPMTDAEFAAANAAYEALPGTEPDGWSFIEVGELGDDGRDVVVERIKAWEPEMTFFRVTDLTGKYAKPPYPEGVYIECWKIEPRKQADFNPPLVAALSNGEHSRGGV